MLRNSSLLYLLLSLLVTPGCIGRDVGTVTEVSMVSCSEIDSLSSYPEKNEYLEFMFQEDQEYRIQTSEATLTYGYNSPELNDLYAAMNKTDDINKARVNCYLMKFGYPDSDSISDIASSAIPMIIHHSSDNTWKRELFPTLYSAYVNGDLDSGGLTYILNRMYESEQGERLVMSSPFKIQDEIDTLVHRLGLDERK